MKIPLTATAVLVGLFAFVPIGMAAQKALTESSLEKAYKSQIVEIDKEIKQLNSQSPTYEKKYNSKTYENTARLKELKDRKQILEVSYSLLNKAFQ